MQSQTSALITCLLLASTAAYAQPAGAQADVLFKRGKQLMDTGKLPEACAAFEASEKLEASTATVVMLATCREQNQQYASAWGFYLQAERELRGVGDPNGVKLRETMKTRAAQLEPRLSKLTIAVAAGSSQVPQLEVIRDNDRIDPGAWNQALPIDGGTYKISARAPDRREWTTTVTVKAEGDTQIVEVPQLVVPPSPTVTAVVTPPQPVEPVDEPPPVARPSYVLPIAIAAGAVALGGGALAFHLAGNARYDDAKAATDPGEQADLWHQANTLRHVAQAFGVASLACAGVAAYFFIRVRSGVAIVPAATGDSAAMAVAGRW